MPPKSKRITHGDLDFAFTRGVGHIVEIAFRIGILEIDRGRDNAMFYRQAQAANSTPPAAPSKCPVIDLVELTIVLPAASPSACLIAFVSQTSPIGVEVPWALM